MTENKNIYSKVAKVMSQVSRVPKNGYNNFHKYNYATESDLTESIRPILLEAGLAFFSNVLEQEKQGEFTKAKMEFTLADIETGEVLKSVYWGEGQDKGDKGLYKAYTGATKYFLMKTFLIPTGDDPEGDYKVDERNSNRGQRSYQTQYKPKQQNIEFDNAEQKGQKQNYQSQNKPKQQNNAQISPPQLKAIHAKTKNIANDNGMDAGMVYNSALIAIGLPEGISSKELTKEQASRLISYLSDLEPVKS